MCRSDSTVLIFLLLLSSLVCYIKSLPTANFKNPTEIVKNSSNLSETDILSPLDFEKIESLRKNETLEKEVKKYMLELKITNETLAKETEAFVRFVLENDNAKIERKRFIFSGIAGIYMLLNSDNIFREIVPGTNWCGAGDRADGPGDYGIMEEADKCCEKHDGCEFHLEPNTTIENLYHTGSYTLSHCDCDDEFYNCLKSQDSLFANLIGRYYFNNDKVYCIRQNNNIHCKDGLFHFVKDRFRCVEEETRLEWEYEIFNKTY